MPMMSGSARADEPEPKPTQRGQRTGLEANQELPRYDPECPICMEELGSTDTCMHNMRPPLPFDMPAEGSPRREGFEVPDLPRRAPLRPRRIGGRARAVAGGDAGRLEQNARDCLAAESSEILRRNRGGRLSERCQRRHDVAPLRVQRPRSPGNHQGDLRSVSTCVVSARTKRIYTGRFT